MTPMLACVALVVLLASPSALAQPKKCTATVKEWAYLPAKTFATPPKDAPGFFSVQGRFDRGPDNYRNDRRGSGPNCVGNNPTLCTDQKSPWKGQAIQGLSAIRVWKSDPKTFWSMSDNGLGNKRNSGDSMLMIHKLRTDWARNRVRHLETLFLSDPYKKVPFLIRNEETKERYLTGADFDVESMQFSGDSIWIGDEFGPYLLEFNKRGECLGVWETPFNGSVVRSPDHPAFSLPNPDGSLPGGVNLQRSKGFEGMARVGEMLHPLLEGPLYDPVTKTYESKNGAAYLRIFSFDTRTRTWGTAAPLKYQLERTSHAIGDFSCVDARYCMIIERDGLEGEPALACSPGYVNNTCFAAPAAFKRIYLIDLQTVDAEGFVSKVAYIDLMDMKDPDGVSPRTRNGVLTFPFTTIEDVDTHTRSKGWITVSNDNNFPYSMGRTLGKADDNEFVVLHVPGFFNGGNC